MLIQTTIDVYNPELGEMGIESFMPVKFATFVEEICGVREYIPSKEIQPDPEKCAIFLKSGESFIANISYQEIIYLMSAQS